jgi:hypothetical protein
MMELVTAEPIAWATLLKTQAIVIAKRVIHQVAMLDSPFVQTSPPFVQQHLLIAEDLLHNADLMVALAQVVENH